MTEFLLDTQALSERVRHYLNYNHIQYNKFSTLVLGVSQSTLSNLLSKPKPWNILSKRVQAYYERMQLWMDTRASYGNNPYHRQKVVGQAKDKKGKRVISKKQRSLLEGDETIEMLRQLEDYTASKEIVEEGSQVQVPFSNQEASIFQEVIEVGELQDIAIADIASTMSNQLMVGQTIIHEKVIVEKIPETQHQDFAVGVVQFEDALESLMDMRESSTEDNIEELKDTIVVYQMEEELPMCQVFMEEVPEEPGTYKLSVVEVSSKETASE